jgi:signal transduction histidine kinase
MSETLDRVGARTPADPADGGAWGVAPRRSGTVRTLLLAPFAAQTWRAFAFVLAGFVLGTFAFVMVAVGLFGGALLAVTFLGLPLLALVVLSGRIWGRAWRWLARVVLGKPVPGPGPRRGQPGLFGFVRSGLSDTAGWRGLAFVVIVFPIAAIGAYGCAIFWAVSLATAASPLVWWLGHPTNRDHGVPHHSLIQLGDYYVDTWPRVIMVALVGVVLCFVAPWPARGLSIGIRAIMRWLLTPTARDERVVELERSRSHAVEDAAGTLRRVERDLHDGTQARLVAMAMTLGRAQARMDLDPAGARELIDAAHSDAKEALVELRDVVRSIRPPALDRGLDAALATLTSRCAVPVQLTTHLDRRPSAGVETIAYFAVAELLTNVTRHSRAAHARVDARTTRELLVVTVWDDGHGGAVEGIGSGLPGLRERAATVDGTLAVDSPVGGPTTITVALPTTMGA